MPAVRNKAARVQGATQRRSTTAEIHQHQIAVSLSVRSQIGAEARSTPTNQTGGSEMATDKTPVEGEMIAFSADMQAQMDRLRADFPDIREVDPAEVSRRMAERVGGAKSLDDLFDTLNGKSSDDLVGRSFEFIDVTWQPYKAQRGIIPQALCTVIDLGTGELTEFVTTGEMLVNFLRRAQQLEAFPFKARIVEKTTKSGQQALNFERV
jgi:hypothetical protein